MAEFLAWYMTAYEASPAAAWVSAGLILFLFWFAAPIVLMIGHIPQLIVMSLPVRAAPPPGTLRRRFALLPVRLQRFTPGPRPERVNGRLVWLRSVTERAHLWDGWLAWEHDQA